MFVKICGFTDPANLATICAADVRPDVVGLNFWEGSKRYVGSAAERLTETAEGADVDAWGVFVNPTEETLRQASPLRLDAVQLHGEEPPDAFIEVGRLGLTPPFVRAWRVGGSLDPLLAHLEPVAAEGRPDYVLLDAAVPGAYGGTGAKLDWNALRAELDRVGDALPPVILAGGLTPENVAEAVRIVRPWGVDVAGGVESAPGIKDPAKVAAFCEAARAA